MVSDTMAAFIFIIFAILFVLFCFVVLVVYMYLTEPEELKKDIKFIKEKL